MSSLQLAEIQSQLIKYNKLVGGTDTDLRGNKSLICSGTLTLVMLEDLKSKTRENLDKLLKLDRFSNSGLPNSLPVNYSPRETVTVSGLIKEYRLLLIEIERKLHPLTALMSSDQETQVMDDNFTETNYEVPHNYTLQDMQMVNSTLQDLKDIVAMSELVNGHVNRADESLELLEENLDRSSSHVTTGAKMVDSIARHTMVTLPLATAVAGGAILGPAGYVIGLKVSAVLGNMGLLAGASLGLIKGFAVGKTIQNKQS